MKKHVFGKGETVLLDRRTEKFLMKENVPAQNEANDNMTITFSNKEYFYILRKMFHTFMFDLKEFGLDFYETSAEEYINELMWLTYVQSIIYKLDLSIEKKASNISPDLDINFELVRDELKLFLQEHDLFDLEIERCIDEVIKYLTFEKEQIQQQNRLSAEEIFNILELKSADLEVLRRIMLKVRNNSIPPQEMEFFKLLDKIREIFDDIRDYEEDLTLKNFNTILYLRRGHDSTGEVLKILKKYIEKECVKCLNLAKQMENNKRKKFLAVCRRLNEEKKYYINQLNYIPFQ